MAKANSAAPAGARPQSAAVQDEDDDVGPGWYESSRDLRRGLWVSETPGEEAWNRWTAANRLQPAVCQG